MWDLLGPGLEPVSPALAGEFLTTAPPGKSPWTCFYANIPASGKIQLRFSVLILLPWWSVKSDGRFAVPQKVKSRVTIGPSNFTPRYKLKRIFCSHKKLYTDIHSSLIHISQKVETTQMSINWQMDKQNVVSPYNGILLSHKKEWNTSTSYSLNESWQYCAKWKKPDTKRME